MANILDPPDLLTCSVHPNTANKANIAANRAIMITPDNSLPRPLHPHAKGQHMVQVNTLCVLCGNDSIAAEQSSFHAGQFVAHTLSGDCCPIPCQVTDETYVQIKGQPGYLYRAVDRDGRAKYLNNMV